MSILKQIICALRWHRPTPRTKLDKFFKGRAVIHADILPELGGRRLDKRILQALSGCPAGGEVTLKLIDDRVIRMLIRHRLYIENQNQDTNVIEIRREAPGYVLYLDYIWFSRRACPEGLGAVALLRMAQAAQSLGFVRIELLAAGGSGVKGMSWAEPYWGYVAWPRFGFDAELQPAMLSVTQAYPKLAQLRYVSELLAVDSEWWRRHGDGWQMAFDLRPDSTSWQTLYSYLSEKRLTL